MNIVIKSCLNKENKILIYIKRFINFFRYNFKNLIIGSCFNLFPIKNNKIVILNYFGKPYGDNGKYICEEIIKQKLDLDIVWLVDKNIINNIEFPNNIRVVEYESLKGLYELSTAKVWVDNCRKFFYPPKRKNQLYIQTWHGAVALKRIERDAQKSLSQYYISSAKNDSKMADILVSNSSFCTELYKKSFWYDGEILECGTPRCDSLMNDDKDKLSQIKQKLGISENVKLVTYAPTFRKDGNTSVYDIDWEKLLRILSQKFGGEWKVLIRLHPNISDKKDFIKYDSDIINATDYPDMYEILNVSEILITDYSSSMFEFSYAKKPVFLYVRDLESYTKDRDFYFDINSLPYSISKTNQELFDRIEQFEYDEYNISLTKFLNKLKIKETGQASEVVVNKIKEFISI